MLLPILIKCSLVLIHSHISHAMSSTKSSKEYSTFCKWLSAVGKLQLLPGCKGLLFDYVHTDAEGWSKVVKAHCASRLDNWQMLRGTLSASDIDQCKQRYLDRFVFVCREKAAKPYVDDVLAIEEAQIQIRIGSQGLAPPCKACRAKDVVIQGLRDQLRRLDALPVESEEDARLEALRTAFHERYILDSVETTPRSDVRLCMEQQLQAMFGEDERLPSYSPLWRRFTDDVIRARDKRSYRPFRCRPRKRVLEYADPAYTALD